jgi:uncharacterized protein (TIGR02246 family)
MMLKNTVIGVAFLAFASTTAHGQSKEDLAALQQLPQLHCDAWNSCDAHALANLFAEDGDFVTVATVYLHGRKDYETFHARLLQGRFKDSRFEPVHTTVRFLRPDLAVIHWSWKMTGDKNYDASARPARFGMMTILAEKRAGNWQIEVAQNTNSLLGIPPELEGIETPIPVPGSDTVPAK